MNYLAYQTYADLMSPMQFFAEAARTSLASPALAHCEAMRKLSAACEVFLASKVTHSRPDFQIVKVMTGEGAAAREVAVHEEAAHVAPFATLLHFRKEGIADQPRVLIVAPMSGH
ncbi:MAG TPA: polyhydroxyalkanoate depolymerase, partial [Undibacterium sp.]|nr:polyhydroxyalkanoate depolymerase [Undibacterium sp.]